MSNLKYFSVSLYNSITVDEDNKEVIEVEHGVPRLYHETIKRGEDSFEEVMDVILYKLEKTKVEDLREYSKYDVILKESFKRVYQRKLREARSYKVDN